MLINRSAGNYSSDLVSQTISAIKRNRAQFTLIEPATAHELYEMAQIAARVKKDPSSAVLKTRMRGQVTGLIAMGGDGTFNLCARAALEGSIPLGIVPMGTANNIALSLYGESSPESIIQSIMSMKYREIDAGRVADQFFFGSIAVGLIPKLAAILKDTKAPRMAYRWASLAARALENRDPKKMVIKVDAFRFETRSRVLNINLLPYTVGLRFSPSSICDDRMAEIIFDDEASTREISDFVRKTYKKKFLFGTTIRQFRGSMISFQVTRGRRLYLDGEIIKMPISTVEVSIAPDKLKVFC